MFLRYIFHFFPCIQQYDEMDCGPASLASICHHYGKKYSLQELREYCFLTKDGVSLLGLEDAAKRLGFYLIQNVTTLIISMLRHSINLSVTHK